MYPLYLTNYAIKASQSLAEGFWKLARQEYFLPSTILVVLDENYRYLGAMTKGDFVKHLFIEDAVSKTIGEFCNKNAKYCTDFPESRTQALKFFVEYPDMNALPVIDNNGNLLDIIFRQQIFYREYYKKNSLPRMYYAHQIYEAAALARALEYSSISVIEFGVAGGRGLTNCEFHAKEISKIFGIDIEVYGFDTGIGLPYLEDYRDMPFAFHQHAYPMDVDELQKRLEFAKLVIGDIRETSKEFMQMRKFSPIGTMFIDVDLYTSTVPILDMLLEDSDNFLPRVHMYFDDIFPYSEYQGELLAINEFNQSNKHVKVSSAIGDFSVIPHKHYIAHLFSHKKYKQRIYKEYDPVRLV